MLSKSYIVLSLYAFAIPSFRIDLHLFIVKMEERGSYLNAKIREGLSEVGKRGTAEQLVDFYDENAEEYNEVSLTVKLNIKN